MPIAAVDIGDQLARAGVDDAMGPLTDVLRGEVQPLNDHAGDLALRFTTRNMHYPRVAHAILPVRSRQSGPPLRSEV